MKYANLHLHSTHSDAGFTPEQLVIIGKSLGYGALALTDHETDSGCKKFLDVCRREGIRGVSGAELYGRCDGYGLHLTALDFDMDDPGIRAHIAKRCDEYYFWIKKCVERALNLGIIEGITWDDVVYYNPEGTWMCIDSIFHALEIKKAMPEGGPDYVRQNVINPPEVLQWKAPQPDAEEVIKLVRKAGGVVALAHPSPKGMERLPMMVEWGLNGIEIDHPNLDAEMSANVLEAAKTYNLYCCGGTDHTGPMGCNGGELAIPVFNGITEEEFDTLVERRLG